jgi:pimeloyl-ACP methyl ester carboxylesterase
MQLHRDRIEWNWRGTAVEVGLTRAGAGAGGVLLMLPALSSISTRGEMRPLARLLASEFTTLAVDWPGFGDAPRPAMAWKPDAYRAFLAREKDKCAAVAKAANIQLD